ncbi:MAG: HEPN domain-containing protein [Euryarchaeota archaeon]|nr:HEPN domain-containing protein [Euryarchaeota archaeon]
MGDRAREYLEAAELAFKNKLFNVAYEEARTAAELAAKVLLIRAGHSPGRDHNPAGQLAFRRLVPDGMSERALSRFLGDSSRGGYGFDEPVPSNEARDGLAMARALVALIANP